MSDADTPYTHAVVPPRGNEARPAGRPLDESVDVAILQAAVRLLHDQGYARMSIAGVAEEAGVGRPAIYRRYSDKADLVSAAIAHMRTRVPAPDTGSTRNDLVEHLERARRIYDMSLMGTLLVEQDKHPELLGRFRERMMQPHREQVAAAIERGKERGDVRKDLDVELAVDAVMGSFMYHTIVVGRPKRGWPERVVDNLWPAFAAKP
jgi:AcrR family transcriptional regulator